MLTNKKKILIADSQILTCEGATVVLQKTNKYEVVTCTISLIDFFYKIKELKPSIIVIDPYCFTDFLIPHFLKLNEIFPLSNILVFTGKTSNENLIKILDVGINHIISKYCNSNEFLLAINSIEKKEKYLSKEVIEALITNNTNKKQINSAIHITNKEIEIIRLISQGFTTKEIAGKIFLSVHTINTHRKNIFKKLNVNNTSELVMYSIKAGIVDTTEYYI